jgi:uncharacterized membrane protein
MKAYGAVYIIFWIFSIVVAVLLILMPFFVLKIRNQVTEMNQKMSAIIKLLREQRKDA